MTIDWPAPTPVASLNAEVILPGSKSQTSRALVIGTIAQRPTIIHGALASRDSYLASQAMEQFGARFEYSDTSNDVTVHPPTELHGGGTIDCGLAGTVMRFAPALAAFANGKTQFIGDEAAQKRPLAPLMDALISLGAKVKYQGEKGYLPLRIRGRATRPTSAFEELGHGEWDAPATADVAVDTTSSSQYLSALLLASPLFPVPTVLRAEGRIPSWPYVQMSIDMLAEQGVNINRTSSSSWLTEPVRPVGNPINIEPDLSNAGAFLAAGLLSGGNVTVRDWPRNTDQVGKYWLDLLPRFGATVVLSRLGLTVHAPKDLKWPGLEFDLAPCGELAPTVAALCLFATSPSTIIGIGHLRGHETDRLSALEQQIKKLGAGAKILRDGIRIIPGPMSPTLINTYNDHRMATFAALVGLRVPGCIVENVETTAKTLPEFPERWNAMLSGATSPEPLWLSQVNTDPSIVGSSAPAASRAQDRQ